jgi:maltose alpha-D-glucosyltransferase/alpha-amylase
MQWTADKNLGFSSADSSKLYLPVDPAKDAPTVAAEEINPNSLLNRTRKLIKLKHTEAALADYAEFVPLFARENTYPFIFARAKGKSVVVVMLNPSGKTVTAEFDLTFPYAKTVLLAGKDLKLTKEGKKVKVIMPGQSYSIIRLE